MIKKTVYGVGILTLIVLMLAGTLYLLTFAGAQAPNAGPKLNSSFELVIDGISAVYFIDLGNGKLAMIDAGLDPKGKVILEALRKRNKSVEDLVAIFLTHSHSDHIATIPLFPRAAIYAGKDELELAAGREAYKSPMSKILHKKNQTPFTVTYALKDGEQVQIGDVKFTAYAIPGHTPGSTAYLVNGGLFLGDAANYSSDPKLKGPLWIFSNDPKMGRASLANLSQRLVKDKAEVSFISTAHTGATEGLGALTNFASDYEKKASN